jgi:predicted Zn finger-like uncharacterized protein
MILTCPKCNSQYRVRNESIPAEGAKLKCPRCELEFQAHPPSRDAAEVLTVVAQLDAARAKLNAEYFEITGSAIDSNEANGSWREWSAAAVATLKANKDELQQTIQRLDTKKQNASEILETSAFLKRFEKTLLELQKIYPDA